MSEKELNNFIAQFKEKFGWTLVARSGNTNRCQEEYLYIFMDNKFINITIDPVDKSFRFEKVVDYIFKFDSGTFSPIDYEDHFEKNYLYFRNIVEEKEL